MRSRALVLAGCLALGWLALPVTVLSATLPQSSQEMLKKLKLESSILVSAGGRVLEQALDGFGPRKIAVPKHQRRCHGLS